jgi:hypothetical protein
MIKTEELTKRTKKAYEGTKAKAIEAGKVITGAAVETGQATSSAAGKLWANLSGEEVYKRITEMVEQQRFYNDILATRLAEALNRIEKLEQKNKKEVLDGC